MALDGKGGQVTVAVNPFTITNIPVMPRMLIIKAGVAPGTISSTATRFSTGTVIFDASGNVTYQDFDSFYNDGTLKAQDNGTGKVLRHFKKSGSSVVDSLVMDCTGAVFNSGSGKYDITFNVSNLDTISIRYNAQG